ncbi:hypothetical protein DVH24_030277 [Malus domestica]|uniref:TIR domain-containing protein n=1 Tax=Malus domestica TaxID=3750 RepID=A0A498K4J4_MALDO|nr:hypothetical protein DVH24_030277 [Malus domestica]
MWGNSHLGSSVTAREALSMDEQQVKPKLKPKRHTKMGNSLPVFYDVDPSDVRKQTGSFTEAFARHRKIEPSDMMERWRKAVDLVGKDVSLQQGIDHNGGALL